MDLAGVVTTLDGLYSLTLQNRTSYLSTLLFIICSTASYFTALLLVFYLPLYSKLILVLIDMLSFAGVFIGGVVGTALFLLSFNKFILPLRRFEYTVLLGIGAALSLVCQIVFIAKVFPADEWDVLSLTYMYFVFVIWQTGMSTALGWIFRTRLK